MAVTIRMKRLGAKNMPYFRIVVTDQRNQRDGAYIEKIGDYEPLKDGDNAVINADRAKYWLSVGAKVSGTVQNIFKKHGILPVK